MGEKGPERRKHKKHAVRSEGMRRHREYLAQSLHRYMNPIYIRRQELGMTMMELGRRCGVDDAIICRAETGKRIPRLVTLAKIAKGLGTPVGQLTHEYVHWLELRGGDPEAVLSQYLISEGDDDAGAGADGERSGGDEGGEGAAPALDVEEPLPPVAGV